MFILDVEKYNVNIYCYYIKTNGKNKTIVKDIFYLFKNK